MNFKRLTWASAIALVVGTRLQQLGLLVLRQLDPAVLPNPVPRTPINYST